MRRPLALAAAVLLALGGLAGCGDDDDDDVTSSPSADGFEEARELTADQMLATVGAVCDAAGQAPGDPIAALRTFNGRAHDGLHSIARQLEALDRAAAATLLKAKEKVESDFSKAAASETIRADLVALAGTAGTSVSRLAPDADPPTCS